MNKNLLSCWKSHPPLTIIEEWKVEKKRDEVTEKLLEVSTRPQLNLYCSHHLLHPLSFISFVAIFHCAFSNAASID